MATPFYFYVVNELGTPYRWWRCDSAYNVAIPDVGDSGSPQNLAKPNLDGTWTHDIVGLIQDDNAKCIEFTANTGTGAPYEHNSAAWFADENIGSFAFLFKGTSADTENTMFGDHPSNGKFAVHTVADGTLYFTITAGASGRFWTGPAGLNDGALHMVAVTCDGTNPNSLYIDGALYTTSSTSTGGGAVAVHDWVNTVRAATGTLGMHVWNSSRFGGAVNKPWLGKIDEVMLFNETLTAAQVEALWDAANGTVASLTPRTIRRRRYVSA